MTASPFRQIGLYGAFWLVVLILLSVDYGRMQTLLLVLCAGWALRSPYHGIQALSVALVATTFNNGVTPVFGAPVSVKSTVTALRIIVILIVAARAIYERLVRVDHPPDTAVLRSLAYALVVAVLAMLSSPLVDVSLFKIAMFAIGILAVMLAVPFAAQDRRDDLFKWIWAWLAAIVVGSFPLLVLPLGYTINGTGFQGWLNQPQAAGVFLAPAVIFFFGLSLFDRLWPRLNLALGLMGTIELFATLSRNAVLTVVIAAAAGVIVSFIREPRRWTAAALFGATSGLLLLALPTTQNFIGGLIVKQSQGAPVDVADSFNRSRGLLVQRSFEGFLDNPLIGQGFGIASDPTTMNVIRDPVLGLPISASVEKGVMWVALLEETGVIGVLLFIVLLLPLVRGSLSYRPATAFALLIAALMTNNGEATLMSFGGMGLFVWMIVVFAAGDRQSVGR